MNNYSDETRGQVQNIEYFQQKVLFDGMKYVGSTGLLNVTPTDIDGFVQLDEGNVFVFFELKYEGDLPSGQKKAYKNLVKTINKGGGCAAVFVAEHRTRDEFIYAKDAIVTRAYFGDKWRDSNERKTLQQYVDEFIDWAQHERKKFA